MSDIAKLIGKTVVAVKGRPHDDKRRKGKIKPRYMQFDDGKTTMEFYEQDYYTFHDCDSSARTIHIREDDRFWNYVSTCPDADLEL